MGRGFFLFVFVIREANVGEGYFGGGGFVVFGFGLGGGGGLEELESDWLV